MPKVSIITVTYNAEAFITAYLSSLAEVLEANADLNLILVDNASTDNTLEVIMGQLSLLNMVGKTSILKLDDNVGFGRGCNAGAEEALKMKVDYLWFLNPDTTIDCSTYDALIESYNQIGGVDFIGSVLKNELGVTRASAYRFPGIMTSFLSEAKIGLLDKAFPRFNGTIALKNGLHQADWLTGASFMVKSEVFKALNGFDPIFFLYFEEVDLFFRAKSEGFSVWCCPESTVYHISGASTGMNTKVKVKEIARRPSYWYESRRNFYIKNYGKVYFLLIDMAFFLGNFTKRIKNFILRRVDSDPAFLLADIYQSSLLSRSKESKYM